MGAYVVRASSLNDKHSCQLFCMGLRDSTTPRLTTPLIRANMSCAVATIFSCFSFFVHLHGHLSRLVIILQSCSSFSSLSMANLSCLVATTFFSLRLLSNSLSSPRFNLLRVPGAVSHGLLFLTTFSFPHVFFGYPSCSTFSRPILSLSFFCSLQSLKLCLL